MNTRQTSWLKGIWRLLLATLVVSGDMALTEKKAPPILIQVYPPLSAGGKQAHDAEDQGQTDGQDKHQQGQTADGAGGDAPVEDVPENNVKLNGPPTGCQPQLPEVEQSMEIMELGANVSEMYTKSSVHEKPGHDLSISSSNGNKNYGHDVKPLDIDGIILLEAANPGSTQYHTGHHVANLDKVEKFMELRAKNSEMCTESSAHEKPGHDTS